MQQDRDPFQKLDHDADPDDRAFRSAGAATVGAILLLALVAMGARESRPAEAPDSVGLPNPADEVTAVAEPGECTAAFEPETLPTGSEDVSTLYLLSESIGEIEATSIDDKSGAIVSEVESARSILRLNTTEAMAGSWEVSFVGEGDVTCKGSLDLAASTTR